MSPKTKTARRWRAVIIHPSGNEPSTKSPGNSLVEGKKGLPVGPSVGPLALDAKQKAQLRTLIETFAQLDPAGRRRLVRVARELASKKAGQA